MSQIRQEFEIWIEIRKDLFMDWSRDKTSESNPYHKPRTELAWQAWKGAQETIASWMMSRGYATGHGDSLDDLLSELVGQTRLKSIAPLYRYDPSTSAFVMVDSVYQTMK